MVVYLKAELLAIRQCASGRTCDRSTPSGLHLLTPWRREFLEKLTGLLLVKEFSVCHAIRRFINAFKTARHLSLSWASSIQSIPPHPTSWRSILILSSHLRLGLPRGLLPSGFPTKTLYTPLPSTIRTTCPAHLFLLDFITHTILGEQYRSLSSSLCSFLHSPVTSSLLGPNILLNHQDFTRFYSVLQEMLSWHPKSTLHCCIIIYMTTVAWHFPSARLISTCNVEYVCKQAACE